MPRISREEDQFVLDILHMRRTKMPHQMAKKLGMPNQRIKEICAKIREADIKYSTRKNVENLIDVVLHYPHS